MRGAVASLARLALATALAVWTGAGDAGQARAESAAPPSFPGEEREPLAVIARGGAGADTNVLRDPVASTTGGLVRGDLRAEWEPLAELHLLGQGVFEGDTASTPGFYYEADADLAATYHLALGRDLSLRLGSFTAYDREPSVFLEGRVLTTGAVMRSQLIERLSPTLSYALGRCDLELGARGELAQVSGIEHFTELGAELSAGVRVLILPRTLSLRLRYTLDEQHYDGLAARNPAGDIASPRSNVEMRIHGVRTSLRAQAAPFLTGALHFDQEWLADQALGFLSGDRQRARTEVFLEVGPLKAEVAAELVLRHFSGRVSSAADPSDEQSFDAWIDSDVVVHGPFGVYGRYQIQRLSAEPTGVVYLRQLVTVGASVRYDSGR